MICHVGTVFKSLLNCQKWKAYFIKDILTLVVTVALAVKKQSVQIFDRFNFSIIISCKQSLDFMKIQC